MRGWRLSWIVRSLGLTMVFVAALVAFQHGVGATDRPSVVEAGFLTHCYYALGLFVLGGMDLGVPVGGPDWARGLLWVSYFLAPAITTGALIESVLRIIEPQWLSRRMMRDHIVLVGLGQWGMLYLERLRGVEPGMAVVVCDINPGNPNIIEARERFGVHFVFGDVRHRATRDALRLSRARGVVLVTRYDLTNLEAAWEIQKAHPKIPILAHVSDIGLYREVKPMEKENAADNIEIFNVHRFAARGLYNRHLSRHFAQTRMRDVVVLAGFGRFGQTILEYLLEQAHGELAHVVLLDLQARRKYQVFNRQVGARDGVKVDFIDGDMTEWENWCEIAKLLVEDLEEPVFIVGGDDDARNLRTALMLRKQGSEGSIFVRCFYDSRFVDLLSDRSDFTVLMVERMIGDEMLTWHQRAFSS